MSKIKTHVDSYNEAPPGDPHIQSLVHPLRAYDQIAQWERVWVESVALAWKEWDVPGGFRERLTKDPRAAVLKEFGFHFPKDCVLEVKEGTVADWEWDPVARTWKHPHATTRLTLMLPFRPALADDRPIALANYVATGQSMPFTCCCC